MGPRETFFGSYPMSRASSSGFRSWSSPSTKVQSRPNSTFLMSSPSSLR